MKPEPENPDEVIEIFQSNQPDYPPHLHAAIGFIQLGLAEEAREELENLNHEQKLDEQVIDMRIQIYHMLEKWDDGITLASSLAAQFPEEYNWPMQLAEFLRHAGRMDDALQVLRATGEQHPDAYPPHYALAAFACVAGSFDEARASLGRAIEIYPEIGLEVRSDPDLEALWGMVDSTE